ncbi:MAG: hypothetical protein NTV03_01360 [Candidatus Nomurabacteria bacterium]|nr:hypothetical protein [Candidatus Nomurabacteria bacterium]
MSKIDEIEDEEQEEYFPEEVVSVEDMTEMIIRNACFSIEMLHEMSFCGGCGGRRD